MKCCLAGKHNKANKLGQFKHHSGMPIIGCVMHQKSVTGAGIELIDGYMLG
jgi:hypothetical protein